MLDARARRFFDGASKGVGRAVGASGVSPNVITVAGLVVTGVAAYFVVRSQHLIAGSILILGGFLDFVDGAVARATNSSTVYGNFLDSVVDRISDAVVFAAIAWFFFAQGDADWGAVTLFALSAAMIVSYMRAKAESLGFDCKVGIAERAERVLVLIAGLMFSVLKPAMGILAVALLITVVQRFAAVRRQSRSA